MVSFELGKERERCFSSCHEHGTKKKICVSMRNRTLDLRIPRSDALPLSHRDSTAGISNVDGVMFVDRNKRLRDSKF